MTGIWTDTWLTVRRTSGWRLPGQRLEPIAADRVLALLSVSASGRASGITADVLDATGRDPQTANIYDFAGGKVRRIRVFLDRQEALEAVGLRE